MCADANRKFIRTFEDLEVFQRSMDMLKPIHDLVLSFPDYEKFDLCSQIRRACKAIPANIAEGYGRRRSAKEFKAFLNNALGSANEIEVHLMIAHQLEYIRADQYNQFREQYRVIAKQFYRLIEHWQKLDALPPASRLLEPVS